jgi:hypothetical protein
MKISLSAATLAFVGLLIGSSPIFAFEQSRPIRAAEAKAFHACLFAGWVVDYCRFHTFAIGPDYDLLFHACVAANGGRAADYCWRQGPGER